MWITLRIVHVVAAAVHFGLGAWATAEASMTNRKWDPAVYVLQSEWQQNGTSSRCTDVDKGCVVVSYVGGALSVNTYALIAVFFYVSAICEACYGFAMENGLAGLWRWLEYALSAGIQYFVISVLSNSLEFFAAFLSAALVAFLQLTGYVLEHSLREVAPAADTTLPAAQTQLLMPRTLCLNFDNEKTSKDKSARANSLAVPTDAAPTFTQFQMIVFVCSSVILCVVWTPVWYHIGRASEVPAFVYGLVAFSFASYLSFGVVMALRLSRKFTAEQCEMGYTVLSFVAKGGVMLIYFFGTRMRDGLVTSAP